MKKIKICGKTWKIIEVDKKILPNGRTTLMRYFNQSYIPSPIYKFSRAIYIAKEIPFKEYVNSMVDGISYAISMEMNCEIKDVEKLYRSECENAFSQWSKKCFRGSKR